MTRTRLGAALTVAVGTATMLAALVAAPGPWWQGYVSEAGTAGQPYAVEYRWGLVLLAAGVALLSRAMRPAGRIVTACLAVAAVLAGTSGAVPCSHQCPLPPYEPTTAADVIHTAASVLGMFLLACAMAATWRSATRAATRLLSAGAVALIVPLGATLGLTMLIAGRNVLGATLERLTLLVAVAWLIGTALLPTTNHRAQKAETRPHP